MQSLQTNKAQITLWYQIIGRKTTIWKRKKNLFDIWSVRHPSISNIHFIFLGWGSLAPFETIIYKSNFVLEIQLELVETNLTGVQQIQVLVNSAGQQSSSLRRNKAHKVQYFMWKRKISKLIIKMPVYITFSISSSQVWNDCHMAPADP